ncbi:MAG: hypothetical protein GX915_10305 [Clostridiales bacterium]|nr:hypothetical protein [Clostridiales bacterium]
MNCPNCEGNISDKKKLCERCGMDLTQYKKIIYGSNKCYNKGLERARVRDLSGAIVYLKNSLELNKGNTNARNLIGLIYFEMGETVAALSEWVISKHFQPDDNEAEEYINKVQSSPTKLDLQNQAIKRYNNALNYAKHGSDDLSIIQLKKVVSLNPHFLRAYQLLALLLIKNGENERAKKTLLKALTIDISNITTLRYLKELDSTTQKSSDQGAVIINHSSSIVPLSSYKEDKPNIIAYVNLVIGVIIGLAVMAFLVIPSIKKNQNSNNNSDYVDFSSGLAKQEETDKTINELTNQNTDLKAQIEALQGEIDDFEAPEDSGVHYDSFIKAVDYYMNEMAKEDEEARDIVGMAERLAKVDESEFTTEVSTTLLNKLRGEIYPKAADIHYDIGHDLYSDGEYEASLLELEKSMEYDPTDANPVYFTARAYHRLKDFDKAQLFYNLVLSDYPDSKRVKNTNEFLEDINSAN